MLSLVIAYCNIQIVFPTTPTVTETDDEWILTNGKLECKINKTTGWVTSLQYDSFEVLDGETKSSLQGNAWQIAFLNSNATYHNLGYTNGIDNYSTVETTTYVELSENLSCPYNSQLTANISYRVYIDRLEYNILFNFNLSTILQGNHTFLNRIATNYSSWDSLIIFGGDHAYSGITQYNQTTVNGIGFFWSYDYLGNNNSLIKWARPLMYPLATFVKSDLAMNFYLNNYDNHSYWIFEDYADSHYWRTDFGCGIECRDNTTLPATHTINNTWVLKFYELDSSTCWTVAPQDYIDSLADAMGWTVRSNVDPTLHYENLMDIWPENWNNQTFLNQCLEADATVLWLYGWQDENETYPLSGNWTTEASGININATYLTNVISSLQSQGFQVYLYMRNFMAQTR